MEECLADDCDWSDVVRELTYIFWGNTQDDVSSTLEQQCIGVQNAWAHYIVEIGSVGMTADAELQEKKELAEQEACSGKSLKRERWAGSIGDK